MIPQLETLDGVGVDSNAKNKVSNGMILEAASAMQLEQEELDDERRMEMEMMGDDMCFGAMGIPSAATGNGNILSGEINSATGQPCTLPNNGSDLTHGSDVVLAGSMASAIRRRRNGSPRASSSGQDSQQGGEVHEPYFGEGDITIAMQNQDKTLKMKMAASPKNSQFRQKKKKSSTNMSLEVNTSFTGSVEGLEGASNIPKSLSNPIAAAIISAAHNQNAMSFDRDDDCEYNSKPGSGGVSGTAPVGWASRPLSSRNHSSRRSSNSNAPSSRSPSPAARNHSGSEGQARKPPKSPPTWQRNASRPQSTTSSRGSTSHGIAGGGGIVPTPSAPFKVTRQDNNNDRNTSPCPSPVNSRAHQVPKPLSSSSSSSNEVLPNLSRRRPKVGSLWDDSSGAEGSDSEEEEFRGRNQRRGVSPSSSSGRQKKNGISPNTVLVKKDNVLRGLLFSDQPEDGVKPQPGRGIGAPSTGREAAYSFDYKDEDEEDCEEFATDHKSRHEFMRSEQKDRDSNKHKQKQMMTFSQATEDSTASSRQSLHSSHSQKSAESDMDIHESSINLSECIAPSGRDRDSSISGKQLSEVATRSLGFDLKGSLAAINQWVDDQDSEDDDDDEEEIAASSSKYGDVWSMRNEMKRATTAQKKILSRDKILDMCTGHTGENSRLTADNLAMNNYNSGYSYDQDDDDEESDVEENDVMFYDNNVDKTTNSLSKSCSLLTIGGFGDANVKKVEDEKKLMSSSLQVDRPPKSSSSPRANRKPKTVVKRESSKNSVCVDEEAVDSRGCTPSSSSMHVEPSQTSSAGVSASSKTSLEADVRNSPSNDTRDDIEKATRTTKKKTKTDKMPIDITKETTSGAALALSEEQLVHMLSQPPKAVPALKTKSGFQDFFRGMEVGRMRQLLEVAYKEMTDLDRVTKVNKRMELLSDVLVTN